jgi:hypothetical protein
MGILLRMSRNTQAAAPRRGIAAAVLLSAMATAVPAAGQVILQAKSASVSQPGGTAPICIYMATKGQQVAGIESVLRWDGTCSTLPDSPHCYEVGSHGKQVQYPHNLATQAEFAIKVLVLSLGDVEPMPDGPVYCCDFQGEADPGQCCNITLTGTRASDPKGQPISASGNSAQICTQGGSNSGGRGPDTTFNNSGMNQPPSASNEPAPGMQNSAPPPAAAPPAAEPAARAPANQVVQGGGARVENPAAPAAPQHDVPALPAPPQVAAQPGAGAGAAAQSGSGALPIAPPTTAAAPTQARPTAAPPVDTPTAKATTRATVPHFAALPGGQHEKSNAANGEPRAAKTERRVANAAPRDAAPAEQGGGWGCQTVSGASSAPVLGLGLLAGIGVLWRRWRGIGRGRGARAQR